MPDHSPIAPCRRLSPMIAVALAGLLLSALGAIGATLWLSWQLEGAAAALDETAGLRGHGYRLALALPRTPGAPVLDAFAGVERQVAAIESSLALLERGDPLQPLALPATPAIRGTLRDVARHWAGQVRPGARQVLQQQDGPARGAALRLFDDALADHVAATERLAGLVERDIASLFFRLRAAQLVLALLAIGAAVFVVVTPSSAAR